MTTYKKIDENRIRKISERKEEIHLDKLKKRIEELEKEIKGIEDSKKTKPDEHTLRLWNDKADEEKEEKEEQIKRWIREKKDIEKQLNIKV